MQRYGERLVEGVAVALALLVMIAPSAAMKAAEAEIISAEEVVVGSDDVRALVAPVALYPDPILALVLQASTLPLEVVQAQRFLDRRKTDSKLQPDPDWDSSVMGLLNYPRQLELMSEYVDWTEELGNTVVDDLASVQEAIQDVRLAAYDAGFLQSNKMQTVEIRDGVVRITSTDPDTVSIPSYDPAALLTALDDVEEIEEAADEAALDGAETEPDAAAAGQKLAPAPAPATAPATTSTPPAAEATMAPAGAYAAEPVTPPTIAYGEPESSFWGDAATFAGGAVVGGLLGWGLTEAFDDDDDDNDWDNDDIEDALRERREYREQRRDDVLAARDERREDRQATKQDRRESRQDRAAQAREKLNQRPEAVGGRTKPAAAASKPKPRQGKVKGGKHDVKLPGAGTQAGVAEKVRKRSAGVQTASAAGKRTAGKPAVAKLTSSKGKQAAAKAGYSRKRDSKGIAASAGSRKQVRAEGSRGAKSRGAARSSSGSGGGQAAAKRSGNRGGGIEASRARGKVASADGARGRTSRNGSGRQNK